ncbi:hypothetical protein YC2023_118146 [Brassica napus]
MDVDVDSSKTNSNSEDPKSEKGKGERKLYVGSQALNYCRDQRRSCLIIDPKEHPMLLAEPPLNTQQAVDYSAFRKNLQVSRSSGCKTDSLTEWDIPSADSSFIYDNILRTFSFTVSRFLTRPVCCGSVTHNSNATRNEPMKSKTSCDRACLLFNAGSEETVVWRWQRKLAVVVGTEQE